MPDPKKSLLSAQVLLVPASGQIPPDQEITAANIGKLKLGPGAEAIVSTFKNAGFSVGNLVGLSFSITAEAKVFEKFFATKKLSGDLPLPANLSKSVRAVTFPSPPDFGPGSFA